MLRSDLDFFLQTGYLILDDAISKEELSGFHSVFLETINRALNRFNVVSHTPSSDLVKKCDLGLIALNEANPDYPLFVQACLSRSPEYYRLCSNEKIMNHVRFLLGLTETSPIYLTNNGIIFTHPNDGLNKRSSNIELEWHRDTFFTIPKSQFLHVWVPLLHDATKENGALQVCVSSQQGGIGKQLINPDAPYDHRYAVDPDSITSYKQESLEVKLGQALLFDSCLIHRSGKNTSDQVRCTLIGLHHDISTPDFHPISVSYGYEKQTPESYFYELFGDEKSIPLLNEQALLKA